MFIPADRYQGSACAGQAARDIHQVGLYSRILSCQGDAIHPEVEMGLRILDGFRHKPDCGTVKELPWYDYRMVPATEFRAVGR